MLNCVDLFAGAGGFSLAAREAGFRLRLAIENEKRSVATYRSNFCTGADAPIIYDDDIARLSSEEIHSEIFQPNEQCDLLLGGPPCQGFSTHRINDAGVKDERNELIHTYFEFVQTFSPSVFLMENVPGMLWPRHAAYLDKFYQQAKQAGYFVFEPAIIDARNFGVPQRRKRVFLLGLRPEIPHADFTWPPPPTHGNETMRRKNPSLAAWEACAAAFLPPPPDDPNDVHMKHGDELIRAFRRTPPNGGSRSASGRILKCHLEHDGHKDVYGRINPALSGPTMTTACINPSKGRFVHPVQHHGITVRQAARMQTFPDDFVFEGGLMAAGRQVGNAVPVRLGLALINHIKPLIVDARKTEPVADKPKKQRAA